MQTYRPHAQYRPPVGTRNAPNPGDVGYDQPGQAAINLLSTAEADWYRKNWGKLTAAEQTSILDTVGDQATANLIKTHIPAGGVTKKPRGGAVGNVLGDSLLYRKGAMVALIQNAIQTAAGTSGQVSDLDLVGASLAASSALDYGVLAGAIHDVIKSRMRSDSREKVPSKRVLYPAVEALYEKVLKKTLDEKLPIYDTPVLSELRMVRTKRGPRVGYYDGRKKPIPISVSDAKVSNWESYKGKLSDGEVKQLEGVMEDGHLNVAAMVRVYALFYYPPYKAMVSKITGARKKVDRARRAIKRAEAKFAEEKGQLSAEQLKVNADARKSRNSKLKKVSRGCAALLR